jgi:hypothetical protein
MVATGWPCVLAILISLAGAAPAAAQIVIEHAFDVAAVGEAVATIAAGCTRCDWGAQGREAVALKVSVDGMYSQHVLLTRGERPVDYTVMLGSLAAGKHRVTIERDPRRSAPDAGEVVTRGVTIRVYDPATAEYQWLSNAPILHARPGTLEKFSDVPLFMYAERVPDGEFAYTVIFSHEDGGTPTDRLMATWGRSTDIEYVYGVTASAPGGEYQGRDHEILRFRGARAGSHPLLWVSTENNMVSDKGPADAVRFAPAPQLVSLDNRSRETVMDLNPWLYRVMASELVREGRIDAAAPAGSGKVADPRRYAIVQACGDLEDATLAFDLGIDTGRGETAWHASDSGDPRFRVARSGCFRSAVRLPEGTTLAQLRSIRARAYTRPARNGETPLPSGSGQVVLRRVNPILMLDREFAPVSSRWSWQGTLRLAGESGPATIPVKRW